MSTDPHLPRPALRRRIEEELQAGPAGVTTAALGESLAQRAHTRGERPPGPHQLVRQLGQLLVEGRIDERDGVWMIIEDCGLAVDPRTRSRAA